MGKLKKVLVVGDIIIDHYSYVKTDRFCQEAAGLPIYDVVEEEERLGGAANVASNIAALGLNEVEVHIAGIASASRIHDLAEVGVTATRCFFGDELLKYRYICDDKLLARFDYGKRFRDNHVTCLGARFVNDVEFLQQYDMIVLSDYDKGTLDYLAPIILKEANCPVVVDSKRKDLRMFEGADFLNINEDEYSIQVSSKYYTNLGKIFQNVIVTLGDRGADLCIFEKAINADVYHTHVEHFKAEQAKAVDVTGCGDTHVAAFVIGLIRDSNDTRNAIRFANQCASLAVQIPGTARITKWDYLKNLEE